MHWRFRARAHAWTDSGRVISFPLCKRCLTVEIFRLHWHMRALAFSFCHSSDPWGCRRSIFAQTCRRPNTSWSGTDGSRDAWTRSEWWLRQVPVPVWLSSGTFWNSYQELSIQCHRFELGSAITACKNALAYCWRRLESSMGCGRRSPAVDCSARR